jgi:hypothetical protein
VPSEPLDELVGEPTDEPLDELVGEPPDELIDDPIDDAPGELVDTTFVGSVDCNSVEWLVTRVPLYDDSHPHASSIEQKSIVQLIMYANFFYSYTMLFLFPRTGK